ncbi:unnamed protein product [Caenorhabditis auriculariae]|uniref:Uncharacterized protein n=1 Tax=Caenorhabditis auriculariae TaxID=2777116 RepID=A0A8S1GWX5_9PELO|nr:unnamed protein product [Caenorhabditis auriculariae]
MSEKLWCLKENTSLMANRIDNSIPSLDTGFFCRGENKILLNPTVDRAKARRKFSSAYMAALRPATGGVV